ncbi:hypothetical protein CMO88_03495 [Candidatus Woesearchaeota archaeon]|nr:hypothetical protein [Candidatus Woesearchaeota archaeon]
MLMLVLIILNIPFCNNSDKIQKTIESDSEELLQLRTDEQLVSYLRTPLPTDLVDKIDKIKVKFDKGEFIEFDKLTSAATGGYIWNLIAIVSFDDAASFLKEHPEVYVGKTYGEFIIALEPFYEKEEDTTKQVFDAVTRTVFVEKAEESGVGSLGRYIIGDVYFSPRIYVKYDADKIEDTDYRGIQGSVRSVGDLGPRAVQGANYRVTYSTVVLPSNRNKITLVQLDIPLGNILMRLPEP